MVQVIGFEIIAADEKEKGRFASGRLANLKVRAHFQKLVIATGWRKKAVSLHGPTKQDNATDGSVRVMSAVGVKGSTGENHRMPTLSAEPPDHVIS